MRPNGYFAAGISMLAFALVLPAPAAALFPPPLEPVNHPLIELIDGEKHFAEVPGEGEGGPSGGFEGACGVALDSTRDIYVSDYYHDVVDVFAPTQQNGLRYETEIKPEDPTNGPCGLAVDSKGDLFVSNWHHEVVEFHPYTYPPAQNTAYEYAGTIDPGPANGVKFDPVTNRIYVDDGTHIAAYEPSGAPVEVGGKPLRIGDKTLEAGYGLAISAYPQTAGEIYVPDAGTNTVKVYDPAADPTNPVKVIDGTGTPQRGFVHLGESEAAVDPVDGHLYVFDEIGYRRSEAPEIVIDEFNPAGGYRGQIVAPPPVKTTSTAGYPIIHRMIEAEPSGIAIGPFVTEQGTVFPDAVYVSAGNSEGGAVWIFGPNEIPAHNLTVTKTGTGDGTVETNLAGINCGSACTAEFDEEAKLTLEASPDPHSEFRGWAVEGKATEPCPGIGTCDVKLFIGDTHVQAEFERVPQRALQVSVSGLGAVGSEPEGIACPGQCEEEFAEGRTILLRAWPDPHQRVAAWSGCDSQPNAVECRVAMEEARSVQVHFEPIPPQSLGVSVSGSGEVLSYPAGIFCAASCTATFDEGSTVYLVASADPGYLFGGWSGSCSGGLVCAVPMDGSESASAEFEREIPIGEAPSPRVPRAPAVLPTPTVTLRRLRNGARRVDVVSATISGPGHLSVAVPLLRHVQSDPGGSGAVTLPVALNGAGEAALRRSPHHRLRVEVTVVFMPTYRGTPAGATTALTFTLRGGP